MGRGVHISPSPFFFKKCRDKKCVDRNVFIFKKILLFIISNSSYRPGDLLTPVQRSHGAKWKIMLLSHTLTKQESHVASLVKFCPVVMKKTAWPTDGSVKNLPIAFLKSVGIKPEALSVDIFLKSISLPLLCFQQHSESCFLLGALHRRSKFANICQWFNAKPFVVTTYAQTVLF